MTATAIEVDGICRIIKACGDSGVSKFSFKDLIELEFHGSDRKSDLQKNVDINQTLARQPETIALTEEELAEPAKIHLTEEDKEAFRHMEELQLSIDDPVAYEQQQIDEHLEEARLRRASPDHEKTEGS